MMKAGVMLKTLGKVETLEAGACFPLVTETAIDAPWWWGGEGAFPCWRTSSMSPSLPAG